MVEVGEFSLGCCDIYLRVSEAKVFMPQMGFARRGVGGDKNGRQKNTVSVDSSHSPHRNHNAHREGRYRGPPRGEGIRLLEHGQQSLHPRMLLYGYSPEVAALAHFFPTLHFVFLAIDE